MVPAPGERRPHRALPRRLRYASFTTLIVGAAVALPGPAAALVTSPAAPSPASSARGPLTPTTPGLVHPWIALNQVADPTVAQATAAARHYDLVVVKSGEGAEVKAMKAANPAMTVLVYHNGGYDAGQSGGNSYPSSWYAHDAKGGKIEKVHFKNYLMDVSNPAWQNNVVAQCRAAIAQSGADGCYTDMMSTAPLFSSYDTALPIDPATKKVWTYPAYQAAIDHIASLVRTQVPGPSAANGVNDGQLWYAPNGASSESLTDNTDAAHAEIWLRYRPGKPPSVDLWREDVNMVRDAEAAGKTLMVETKVWVNATKPLVTQWGRYSLASFLLATSGKSWFLFSPTKNVAGMLAPDPDENAPIGTPTGPYSQVGDSNVFIRHFTTGFDAVNAGSTTASVTLPAGAWTDLNGHRVSGQVSLPARSGMLWSRSST